MTTIAPHPETERLQRENEALRDEVTRLLADASHLVQVVRPNLLALYQTRLGAVEMELLRAQLAVAALRRAVTLVQADLNRGQTPDPGAVDATLGREFADWRARVDAARERVEEAQARLKALMPEEQALEFRQLYRALVKRLHPDLNPHLGEDGRRLWQRVQDAYARGDLEELKGLAVLAAAGGAPPAPAATSLDRLRAEQAALAGQARKILGEIEALKAQPPFTLEAQLADDAWVAARLAGTRRQIDDLEAQAEALRRHLNELLAGRVYEFRISLN